MKKIFNGVAILSLLLSGTSCLAANQGNDSQVRPFLDFVLDKKAPKPFGATELRQYLEKRITAADSILEGSATQADQQTEGNILNPYWDGNDKARLQMHYWGFCRANATFPERVIKNLKAQLAVELQERNVDFTDDSLLQVAYQTLSDQIVDEMLVTASKAFAQAAIEALPEEDTQEQSTHAKL